MKEFNTVGICQIEKHYMCDVTAKFNRCSQLIESGKYFAINFPRQHGKTTMQNLLAKSFEKVETYLVISTSFEGIGDLPFESEKNLAGMIPVVFAKGLFFNHPELADWLEGEARKIENFQQLSRFISDWVSKSGLKIVLLLDEIDKASNNQVFINFLSLLRDKYLAAAQGRDATFHSVVLIGIHDVKTLKLKLTTGEERKLNSPWNIAVDLDIEFTFTQQEIEPMLVEYAREHILTIDSHLLAQLLFYYTNGNPFLISKMCQVIDEVYMRENKRPWASEDIDAAYTYLVDGAYTTTHFDDIDKNLENNEDLFHLVKDIVINGMALKFNVSNPVIAKGKVYGILRGNEQGLCDISNKIYEYRILDYLLSKQETDHGLLDRYRDSGFISGGRLNIELILERFQWFMREHHSSKDNDFLESNGRVLLMSFFRPIINGKGYLFKENVTAEDRRMDLVVTYNNQRYVIELKIWYGEKRLQDGLDQLCSYLDSYRLNEGYIIVFNFNKNKAYDTRKIVHRGKRLTAVFV